MMADPIGMRTTVLDGSWVMMNGGGRRRLNGVEAEVLGHAIAIGKTGMETEMGKGGGMFMTPTDAEMTETRRDGGPSEMQKDDPERHPLCINPCMS